jgi:peptidoglycan/LPS O-acetylase OafA/YrhL
LTETSITGTDAPDAAISYEKNALDILRYFAAFSVMLLHYTGYSLMLSENGRGAMHAIRSVSLLFPGVVILFTISGFLIPASFERSGSNRIYFRKRVLRLYPELWVCTLVNLAFLFILAGKKLDRGILVWLATQAVGFAYTPGCLKDFATGSANGALWTVFVEIQFYIIVPFLWPLLKKAGRVGWGAVLAAGLLLNIGSRAFADLVPDSMASRLLERLLIPYLIWFLTGMFLYRYREKWIPVLKRGVWLLLAVYVLLRAVPVFSGVYQWEQLHGYYAGVLTTLLVPVITIGLAYRIPAKRIRTDLSYELFLYHWIVLNGIVYFDLMNRIPWGFGLLLFIAISAAAAWSSYRFVGRNTAVMRKKMEKENG